MTCSTPSVHTGSHVELLVSGHSTQAENNDDVPKSKRKKQNGLDRFRKRQLELEDRKLEKLRKVYGRK